VHLLLCTTPDQQSYLSRFSTLSVLIGHKVSVLVRTPDTLSELESQCRTAGITGILCANQSLLERILDATPDFIHAPNRKALTLDDYQGSFLSLRSGIPVVVLNPPEQIMTVPYGAFIFCRFIKKLTAPAYWFPQTAFSWSTANERDISETYNDFQQALFVSVDIETPIPNPNLLVNCISFTAYFADHTTHSLVIPFTDLFWLTWVRKFCSLDAPKVLQGGTYDAVYLLRFNCPLRNWFFDTLNLFHSWYAECPKRLDFVAAFALRTIRFWKDDGKTGNLEDYYRYNALDGWATINAFLALMAELPEWAIANYVEEFPQVFPAIHCELEGWKVDKERFEVVSVEKKKEVESKLVGIRRMTKAPFFNPRSPKQMLKLFAVLGCGDLTSTDKANSMKAEFRHPLNSRVLGEIKAYKEGAKLLSTYILDSKFLHSPKGVRLLYRLNPAGTDTGRFSSSESSFWLGFQIQNIPRGDSIKQFLVSDSGWLLSEPDCKQSEARCVAYLSGDSKLLWLVESGKDFHAWNVKEFFGIPYEKIWDQKTEKPVDKEADGIRYLAKRIGHGDNYNMKENTLLNTMGPKNVTKAKLLLRLDPKMTLKAVCALLLKRSAAAYPQVKGLFYQSVVTEIEITKRLTSPLGHTRWCFGDPKNNHHYFNSMVAHKPQNLSGMITNRNFYKLWWEQVYGKFIGVVRIKANIHDSTPYQYKEGAEWVNTEVKKMFTVPVEIVGADKVKRTMVIPIGMASGGKRWSDLK